MAAGLAAGMAFGVVVAANLGPAVVLTLMPGGHKGRMRRTREARVPMEVGEAYDVLVSRLEYDGFKVDASERAAGKVKVRRGLVKGKVGVHMERTNASKALIGEGEVVGDGAGGSVVRLTLWMKDYIFYDTGEGRQVELTLDRLLAARLEKEAPPATAGPSYASIVAVTAGVMGLVLAVGPVVWAGASRLEWGVGVVGAGVYAIVMGVTAVIAVRSRPREVTGFGKAVVGMGLGLLGVAAGAGWAAMGGVEMVGK